MPSKDLWEEYFYYDGHENDLILECNKSDISTPIVENVDQCPPLDNIAGVKSHLCRFYDTNKGTNTTGQHQSSFQDGFFPFDHPNRKRNWLYHVWDGTEGEIAHPEDLLYEEAEYTLTLEQEKSEINENIEEATYAQIVQ